MPTYSEVPKQFGNLIAESEFVAAHRLLTTDAQAAHTPDDFREAVGKNKGVTSREMKGQVYTFTKDFLRTAGSGLAHETIMG